MTLRDPKSSSDVSSDSVPLPPPEAPNVEKYIEHRKHMGMLYTEREVDLTRRAYLDGLAASGAPPQQYKTK